METFCQSLSLIINGVQAKWLIRETLIRNLFFNLGKKTNMNSFLLWDQMTLPQK